MVHIRKWVCFIEMFFLFLLPTQLGTFYFFKESYISGVRFDYLAPAIYLTDIVSLVIILLHYKSVMGLLNRHKNIVYMCLIVALVNIGIAQEKIITVYKIIKYIEGVFLLFCFSESKLTIRNICTALFLGTSLELSLCIFQFLSGHSLQGIWYYLGERFFTLGTPGIARISYQGREFIRPYGTFSHPNSMAGFYLLIMVCAERYIRKSQFHFLVVRLLIVFSQCLILFSFSKIAISTMLLAQILFSFRETSQCSFCRIIKIIGSASLAAVFLLGIGDVDSIQKRIFLTQSALQIIGAHPFLGIGLGNYLYFQSKITHHFAYYFLEPVHNIFLLFIAEMGLPVAVIASVLMAKKIRRYILVPGMLEGIFVVVFTGMFDHYWLTLQQNFLAVAVLFGLIVRDRMIK